MFKTFPSWIHIYISSPNLIRSTPQAALLLSHCFTLVHGSHFLRQVHIRACTRTWSERIFLLCRLCIYMPDEKREDSYTFAVSRETFRERRKFLLVKKNNRRYKWNSKSYSPRDAIQYLIFHLEFCFCDFIIY